MLKKVKYFVDIPTFTYPKLSNSVHLNIYVCEPSRQQYVVPFPMLCILCQIPSSLYNHRTKHITLICIDLYELRFHYYVSCLRYVQVTCDFYRSYICIGLLKVALNTIKLNQTQHHLNCDLLRYVLITILYKDCIDFQKVRSFPCGRNGLFNIVESLFNRLIQSNMVELGYATLYFIDSSYQFIPLFYSACIKQHISYSSLISIN